MRRLVGASVIAMGFASPALAQGRLSVDSVISWLPANTETLIVAKGSASDTSKPEPGGFASLLADIAAFGPTFSRTRSIFQPLHNAQLRFAVEGARAFRQPTGFGFAPYDGCHIAVFEPGDVPLIEEFLRAAQAASDSSLVVASFSVLRLRWRAEDDNWSAFVVRLRQNVIIISRSEAMLAEVLERATRPRPASAFQSTIPEWSAVDTTAHVWAIRQFGRTVNDRDVKSLDSLAVGVTVSIATDSSAVVAH